MWGVIGLAEVTPTMNGALETVTTSLTGAGGDLVTGLVALVGGLLGVCLIAWAAPVAVRYGKKIMGMFTSGR